MGKETPYDFSEVTDSHTASTSFTGTFTLGTESNYPEAIMPCVNHDNKEKSHVDTPINDTKTNLPVMEDQVPDVSIKKPPEIPAPAR